MDKPNNLIRSNSVPSLNILKSSFLAVPKLSEAKSSKHEISNKSSLNQLTIDDCITIQSQLSIENQNSEIKSFNNTSRHDIEALLSPRKVGQEDPVRVIKITEIIEINNKNNPEHCSKKTAVADKNVDIFSKLNINKERITSIQNTNYKVSPNGSFYELSEIPPLLAPEVESVVELKRRNELLESEIRLMKEKFSETQLLLEAIKSQNMTNSRIETPKESFITIPVIHNFSFIRPPDDPGTSSCGQNSQKQKKISVKIFGRTRSQSGSNRAKEKEPQQTNWNIGEEEPSYIEQMPNVEMNLNPEEQKFDLDKFKFYLKQLNSSGVNSSTTGYENYPVVISSLPSTIASPSSAFNRSSSMPPTQLANNFKSNKQCRDLSRPAVVPMFRNNPQRSLINSKWTDPIENVNSFCSNQHVSLVQNADEIIGRNLSAFSSVKISNNSANGCVAVEPSITNVGRIDEDAASEMQIQGDEVPVWTYRGATDAGAVKTKGYDLKKELLKNQIPANLNTDFRSTFSCGLLNKFYTNKHSSDDQNSTNLYKEEDENYEKNNSPSLSISSSDTPGAASAVFNFSRQQKNSTDSYNNNQNSPKSSQKILNLIENYLQRHTINNNINTNENSTESKEFSYESYLLKKINEKEKTSSLPLRQPRSTKKAVSTYYNDFYKDQLLNTTNSMSKQAEYVPPAPPPPSEYYSTNAELYGETRDSVGADFNAKYIDEEDYSDEYNENIKRNNGNETKELVAAMANEQQMNLSTFTLNKTPKMSRRVIFADEVNS